MERDEVVEKIVGITAPDAVKGSDEHYEAHAQAHAILDAIGWDQMGLVDAFAELGAVIEKHRNDLNLSFGLEYSSIIDWVADLTPRRNHPKARQYGEVWRGQGGTPESAMRRAIREMQADIDKKPPDWDSATCQGTQRTDAP